MATPSDTTPLWANIIAKLAPLAGALGTYIVGRSHQKGKNDERIHTLEKRADKEEERGDKHDVLLIEHTMLHKGAVSMQSDIRATMNAVNRIAGHLNVKGTE